ncbi:MAG: helix-turn-helix transcriptional regulator [Pseudomonadota bacterium]
MANHSPDPGPVFAALSDPCRRAVITRLARGDEVAVGDLAADHAIALPTFLKHLNVLERANLIATRKSGRTRLCRFTPAGLSAVETFLNNLEAGWSARLDRLEQRLKERDR